MSTGIILAFAAMLFWGIHDTILKPLTDRFHPIPLALYKMVPDVIMMFFIFLYLGFSFPMSIPAWSYILLFGIIGTVGYYTFLRAIGNGLVSLSVPIAHAYIIITAVFSALLLGEILNTLQYTGIALVVVGVFFLSQKQIGIKLEFANKGVRYALFTAFLWGFLFVVMKFMVLDIGAMASAFYGDLSITLFMFLAYLFSRQSFLKDMAALKHAKTSIMLVSSAMIAVLATICMMFSSASQDVALSMGIISAAPMVVAVLSFIFLKERINSLQCASIVALTLGMVLLSL